MTTTFVSWAHHDEAWESNVATLVFLLRRSGIDADVDLFHLDSPGIDWSTYGPRAIVDSDRVLIVPSGGYKRRWEGSEAPGVGPGAAREANVLKGLFDQDQNSFKVKARIVLLPGASVEDVPLELRSTVQRFAIETLDDPGVVDLLRNLTGQPRFLPAPLGPIPLLPPDFLNNVLGPVGDSNDLSRQLEKWISRLRDNLESTTLSPPARNTLTSQWTTSRAALAILSSMPGTRSDDTRSGDVTVNGVTELLRDRLRTRAAAQLDPDVHVLSTMAAVETACERLADAVIADEFQPEVIVAWRSSNRTYPGSEIVATLLASLLGIPVHVTVVSEVGEHRELSAPFPAELESSRILVVDDACYSGKTLRMLQEGLRTATAYDADVRSAVLTSTAAQGYEPTYTAGHHSTEELFFPWGWSRHIGRFQDINAVFGIRDRRSVDRRTLLCGDEVTVATEFTGAVHIVNLVGGAANEYVVESAADTFNYVVSGSVYVRIDGKERQLNVGDYLFIPRNVRQEFRATGASVVLQLLSQD